MKDSIRNSLLSVIRSIQPKNIMVVGDLMLDHYVWGMVERISQEAPIPIVKVEKEEFKLGGAANVAANLNALGCDAFPVGCLGICSSADHVMKSFESLGISTKGVYASKNFQTIVKQRFLSNQQQLLRVDYEADISQTTEIEEHLIPSALEMIAEMDCIIIEDYAKGVVTEKLVTTIIAEAKKRDIPVVCDPGKGVDFSLYKGCTTIKPNRSEVEVLTGIRLTNRENMLDASKILKARCQADFLSISLDKDGILLYQDEKAYSFVKTEAREIYDTTGGGDIVISILAILLANQITPELCVYMANVAAELEMLHMGVVPIPWSEIEDHLNNDGLNQKIVTLETLHSQLEKEADVLTIFTNGYFDNISSGHLKFLLEMNKFKGRLIIGINSDASIARQKGQKPLLEERDRARILASLENVFRVVIFDDDNASQIIKTIRPDIVVKGDRFRDMVLPESGVIKEVNAKIEYISHY